MSKRVYRFDAPARLLVLALGLLAMFSCRKEVSVENGSGPAGDFRAQINGVEWIAADTAKGASMLAGLTNITGISADHKQLSITLSDTVTGVYSLNQGSTSYAAYADNDSSDIYAFSTSQGADTSQAGGLVILTEIDRVKMTISGTFFFKLFRDIDSHQKIITSGVFYKLSYANSLPTAKSTDTLQASIDGSSWTAQSIDAQVVSGQLGIAGSLVNGSQTVGLIMPTLIAPGSYDMDFTLGTFIGLYNPTPTVSLASSKGTLTILANSVRTHRIRGNFQFLATDLQGGPTTSHNLTNGFFSIYYGQ